MNKTTMFSAILLLFLTINQIAAQWSGILLSGAGTGGTQIYIPGSPPINAPNVNFSLPNRPAQAAVVDGGSVYIIGGGYPAVNIVTVFSTQNNDSQSDGVLKVA